MSLVGALNIGTTAIAVQQAALQVTGNNISNAGNADYSRQVTNTSPAADQSLGNNLFVGTGVELTSIQRQIDDALNARLRGSSSDSSAADTSQQWLSQIETVFNAVGDSNLSTKMGKFFGDWSALANKPQDISQRQLVLQDGASLAQAFADTRTQLSTISTTIDTRIATDAKNADSLAQQVADLNGQIVVAEGGGNGQANNLRDSRDAILKQLSQLVDIKTVQQSNGTMNVYVGSEALVNGTTNQGLTVTRQTVNGQAVQSLIFKTTKGQVPLSSGELSGLLSSRTESDSAITQVDTLAHNLVFELNKLHASGQGTSGVSSVTGTNAAVDPAAALNTPTAGLAFTPTNGSFVIHVKQNATGQETSTLVQVDLDGLNGNDTTLNSLAASLNGVGGVTASVSGGKLTIGSSSSGAEISFSQDNSGVLASLGINTFFSGKDASDIAVNSVLQNQPSLLAAAKNGNSADNQTALAIAALGTQSLTSLGGTSLNDSYQSLVNGIATKAAGAKTDSDASKAILDTLSAQHDSVSGVSLDEEAVNLMRQQRAFQGAAKLITTVNELMQTILNMLP